MLHQCADVVVAPRVGSASLTQVHRIPEFIEAGRQAARLPCPTSGKPKPQEAAPRQGWHGQKHCCSGEYFVYLTSAVSAAVVALKGTGNGHEARSEAPGRCARRYGIRETAGNVVESIFEGSSTMFGATAWAA